jgi:ABC-type Zn2+ transport system substrate-binding protein/surface adhesin
MNERFRDLAVIKPVHLWIEMHNAKSVGHTNRTILTQLLEPNQHIKIKPNAKTYIELSS